MTPLVRARGAEVGLRTVRIKGLQSTVALWYLGLDPELLFVGDAGTTEAGRPSRRVGLEWTNYARLTPWLTVDGDLALTRARFRGDDPAGNEVPGALDRVISAGLTVEPHQPLFGSLRVRHFGPRPLIEDGSVRSKGTRCGMASSAIAPRLGVASCSSGSLSSTPRSRTSTTSTRRACRVNRLPASKTSTPSRRAALAAHRLADFPLNVRGLPA